MPHRAERDPYLHEQEERKKKEAREAPQRREENKKRQIYNNNISSLQTGVSLCLQHKFGEIKYHYDLLQLCRGGEYHNLVNRLDVLYEFLLIEREITVLCPTVRIISSTGLQGYFFAHHLHSQDCVIEVLNFDGYNILEEITLDDLQRAFATCKLVNFKGINLTPAAIVNIQRAWGQLDHNKHRPRLNFENVTVDAVSLAQLVNVKTTSLANASFVISVNNTITISSRNNGSRSFSIEIGSSANASSVTEILGIIPADTIIDITTTGNNFAVFSQASCDRLQLRTLNVNGQFFNDEVTLQWRSLLKQHSKQLRQISVTNATFATDQKSAMINAFLTSGLDSLQSLDLTNAGLNDADLEKLAPWISTHKNLREIKLLGNNFSEKTKPYLIQLEVTAIINRLNSNSLDWHSQGFINKCMLYLIQVINYLKTDSSNEELKHITNRAITLFGEKVMFNEDSSFVPDWPKYESERTDTSVNPFLLSTLLNYLARCLPEHPNRQQWPRLAAQYYMFTQYLKPKGIDVSDDKSNKPTWIKMANKFRDRGLLAHAFLSRDSTVDSWDIGRVFVAVMNASDLKTCSEAIAKIKDDFNSKMLADLDLTIKVFEDHDALNLNAAENSKSLSASSMLSPASAAAKSAAAAGKVPSAPALENKTQTSSTSASATSSTTIGSRVVGFINSIFSPEPSAPPADLNVLANVVYPPEVTSAESSTMGVISSLSSLSTSASSTSSTTTSVVKSAPQVDDDPAPTYEEILQLLEGEIVSPPVPPLLRSQSSSRVTNKPVINESVDDDNDQQENYATVPADELELSPQASAPPADDIVIAADADNDVELHDDDSGREKVAVLA